MAGDGNGNGQYAGCRHRGVSVMPGAPVGKCLECNSEVDLATVERLWCLFEAQDDASARERATLGDRPSVRTFSTHRSAPVENRPSVSSQRVAMTVLRPAMKHWYFGARRE